VQETHPLIKLANTIDWARLMDLVLPDLKNSTTKLKWWFGRKLCLRTYLGVYLLQQLLNATDHGEM
jgi:transposase, IS5 family